MLLVLQVASSVLGLQVSKDEEELAKKRLEVKKGLPLQDLAGKRGFPEDGRALANQQLQAEVHSFMHSMAERENPTLFRVIAGASGLKRQPGTHGSNSTHFESNTSLVQRTLVKGLPGRGQTIAGQYASCK